MSNSSATTRWKCLFFGMPCAFSAPILAALDRPDTELVGVVTPQSVPGPEPFRLIPGLRSGPALAGQGRQFHAPRFLVRDIGDQRLQSELHALRPDLIVVACYPRLVPGAVASAARLAAINVHPSLLPRHRGPDPLFWTFHAGDDRSGVTIHAITSQFDAGDILLQGSTEIAPDESLPHLEQRLARLGATLLGRLIDGLPEIPPPTPQDHASDVSETWPTGADRAIDATWTVARARRFIAGVAASHGPLAYRAEAGALPVSGLAPTPSGVEISLRDGTLSVASGSSKTGAEPGNF